MIKTGWYFPADRDAMARLVYRMKRYRDADVCAYFAHRCRPLLVSVLSEVGQGSAENTAVVAVPRSYRAVLRYGHDQARELAKALAREMKLPLLTGLRRHRNVPFRSREQKQLRVKERRSYAEAAYVWHGGDSARGKTVILVDDICTSGETAAACCRQLLGAGATQVFLAVMARTRNLEREQIWEEPPCGQTVLRAAESIPADLPINPNAEPGSLPQS